MIEGIGLVWREIREFFRVLANDWPAGQAPYEGDERLQLEEADRAEFILAMMPWI